MANKKNNGISIANIIALIGLAIIGVGTFFGGLFHSKDGKPGIAILWAVVLVGILVFLLYMSIKAKKAEDELNKWKFVEYGSLVAYILVAVFSSSCFNNFFYIIEKKDEMKEDARMEIKEIQLLYTNYEHWQKARLDEATEQIKNYKASHQNTYDKKLRGFVNDVVGQDVDKWREKAEKIVKVPDKSYNYLKDLSSRVESWNLFDLPSLANDLEQLDHNAWTNLDKHITNYGTKNQLIPVIGGGISTVGNYTNYYWDEYAKFDLGEYATPQFAPKLRKANGFTVLGIVFYIIAHLLVLLNYVATTRTYYVAPNSGGGKNATGGAEL